MCHAVGALVLETPPQPHENGCDPSRARSTALLLSPRVGNAECRACGDLLRIHTPLSPEALIDPYVTRWAGNRECFPRQDPDTRGLEARRNTINSMGRGASASVIIPYIAVEGRRSLLRSYTAPRESARAVRTGTASRDERRTAGVGRAPGPPATADRGGGAGHGGHCIHVCPAAAAASEVALEFELTGGRREKVLKQDAAHAQYEIVVIGEEAHVAYNRVGLTSFFEHRKIEDLYLNPTEWVRPAPLPPAPPPPC